MTQIIFTRRALSCGIPCSRDSSFAADNCDPDSPGISDRLQVLPGEAGSIQVSMRCSHEPDASIEVSLIDAPATNIGFQKKKMAAQRAHLSFARTMDARKFEYKCGLPVSPALRRWSKPAAGLGTVSLGHQTAFFHVLHHAGCTVIADF